MVFKYMQKKRKKGPKKIEKVLKEYKARKSGAKVPAKGKKK